MYVWRRLLSSDTALRCHSMMMDGWATCTRWSSPQSLEWLACRLLSAVTFPALRFWSPVGDGKLSAAGDGQQCALCMRATREDRPESTRAIVRSSTRALQTRRLRHSMACQVVLSCMPVWPYPKNPTHRAHSGTLRHTHEGEEPVHLRAQSVDHPRRPSRRRQVTSTKER